MNTLKGIIHTIAMILIALLIFNMIFYLLGAFVASDWNFTQWWLATSPWGRLVLVIIEIYFIGHIPDFWDAMDF